MCYTLNFAFDLSIINCFCLSYVFLIRGAWLLTSNHLISVLHDDGLDNLVFLNVQVYWVEEKISLAGLKVRKFAHVFTYTFRLIHGSYCFLFRFKSYQFLADLLHYKHELLEALLVKFWTSSICVIVNLIWDVCVRT